jgi:hypothetical protein
LADRSLDNVVRLHQSQFQGWRAIREKISSVAGSDAASLDGRVFRVAAMGAAGEASEATHFEYHEQDGLVWARYEGGAVRLGFLVGIREGDSLDFRYSQLNEDGETSNGHCSTTISTLPDGRLRLDEEWTWESRPGAGASAVEEVHPSRGP